MTQDIMEGHVRAERELPSLKFTHPGNKKKKKDHVDVPCLLTWSHKVAYLLIFNSGVTV